MTNRLIIGDPRRLALPPKGKPPCVEPASTQGTNVLLDPGFELSGAQGLWDAANTQMHAGTAASAVAFVTNQTVARANPGDQSLWPRLHGNLWVVPLFSTSKPGRWRLSETNPHSGSWHARCLWDTSTYYSGAVVEAIGYVACGKPLGLSTFSHPYVSAKANSGDFITMSAWAVASTTTGTPQIGFVWKYFDQGEIDAGGDGRMGEDSIYFPLTTSYALYTHTFFVPDLVATYSATQNWAHLEFQIDMSGGSVPTAATSDVDDVVLGVQS